MDGAFRGDSLSLFELKINKNNIYIYIYITMDNNINNNINNISNSKQLYINFLDKLVENNIITMYCKNKLIDLLDTNEPKSIFIFKKHFNALLDLSDVIQ